MRRAPRDPRPATPSASRAGSSLSLSRNNRRGLVLKWVWLGGAVAFLSVVTWVLNDIRLQVHQSVATVNEAGATINTVLPAVVERTEKSTDIIVHNLPEVVDK